MSKSLNTNIEKKINETLDTIRPFLINEGGNIEFIRYDSNTGTIFIKMIGACAECSYIDYTLNEIIKDALQEEIPEIKKVINL